MQLALRRVVLRRVVLRRVVAEKLGCLLKEKPRPLSLPASRLSGECKGGARALGRDPDALDASLGDGRGWSEACDGLPHRFPA